ncbi:hypothetical protein Tco_1014081 [Tanacetum coccineum]
MSTYLKHMGGYEFIQYRSQLAFIQSRQVQWDLLCLSVSISSFPNRDKREAALQGSFQLLKGKSFDEIQKLFDKEMKRVNTFVAMGSEVQESKEKKVEGSEDIAKGSRKKMLGRKRATLRILKETKNEGR